uniref:Ig-like domain-containing protein n=1 Tax=Amphimedon queenslandica TaxID=400682 RepID=A0A1X7UT87_AMPQE
MLSFAVLLSLLRLSASVHPAEFEAHPHSVNITQGQTATFNCTAHSIGSYWLVNDRLPEHDYNSGRGITTDDTVLESSTNLKEHLLKIPAIPLNNNVTIQCFIFNGPAIPSNLSRLLIQGRLNSVTNIDHIELNKTALLLTFTPPATLLGVPISNYSIEFVDKNTTQWTVGNNPVLPIQPSDYCTKQIMIKVLAWNGVGEGEPNNYTYTLHEVPSTFSHNTDLSYAANGINVLLYSKINNTDCIGKRPARLSTVIKRKQQNQETTLSCYLYDISNSSCSEVSIAAVSDSVWSVTVNISSYLLSGEHYTAETVFTNEAGNTSETVRTFSTYQITNATVKHSTENLICVACSFIPGTILTGCYIVFIDTQYNENKTLQVPKTGSNCESTLYSGVYDIYIYEGSNAFGSAPAIIINNKFINTSLIRISTSSSGVAMDSTSSSYVQSISTSRVVSLSSSQYTSVTKSTTLINSHTPTLNSQPGGSSDELSSTVLLVIAFVVGIILTLTITSVILLSYCLVKTKKKNKILKLAETAASEKFKHADVLLQTLKGTSFKTHSSYLSCSLPSPSPS